MKIKLLCLLAMMSLTACDNAKISPRNYPENPKGFERSDSPAEYGDWFLKDPVKDQYEGLSSNRALAELGLKNEREIIVAVIDSGVDIAHEDLQGKIWQNPGETGLDASGNDKATNNLDDDNNGYVDDVHGWNFIGGSDGSHINYETLEMTREMVRYDKRIATGQNLTDAEKAYYKKVEAEYNAARKDVDERLEKMNPENEKVTAYKAVLKEKLGLEEYTKQALEKIQTKETNIIEARDYLLEITKEYRSVARFERVLENAQNSVTYLLNKEFNPRTIVGDDPDDFSQIHYGNNDVTGPDADHGTHVAGIIAAKRGNGIGIDGVAENVKIMALRVVPNGDERDKDIALAVKYAVANGAHIINMSFGKAYSPSKSMVDAAFLEAAQKGVLIFHAAGNDSKNNDLVPSYPSRNVQNAAAKNLPEKISTWVEIGASAKDKGLGMVAIFSNYGKQDVDIFAPGFELNSTIPGNKYAVFSGTSMATPAAAGAAALLMSNFSSMTGAQAKAILLHESRLYDKLEVRLPGSAKLDIPVPFADLSSTGGVMDVFKSISFAQMLIGQN
ncbi:MAG: S8 family serine peptidase [Bdellovibrionales bacterium]|nr:S8 family serine peptidase [Bdellovibrionales bacterium]